MILLGSQLIANACVCVCVFLYYCMCLPIWEMTVLTYTFLLPCSACILVAGNTAGWNAWVLLFSKLPALWPKALSSLCSPCLCQSRGLVTFAAHLPSAQFKAGSWSQCVSLLLKALLCTQEPQQLHLKGAPTAQPSTHPDKLEAAIILASSLKRRWHATLTCNQHIS